MICAMHPASAQVMPEPSQLSQELVSARIQTLREAGSQDGSDGTLDNYAQVLNWLGEAQAHAAAEKTYLASLTAAPKIEADIRARMESRNYAAPGINPAKVSRLSNSKIGEKLTSFRVQLLDASSAKDNLDRRIATEQSSAPNMQARFEAIDTGLQELPADVITIESEIQPSQFESLQWAVLAERTALVAERRALEARLSSQPVRYSRRKAESDELSLTISGLQTAVDMLEAELAARADNLEDEARIKLDENAPGYTFVHRFVVENETLRSQRTDLGDTLEALKQEQARVKQTNLLLLEQFNAVKQIVELAQNSSSLGLVLMAHWHQADAFRLHVAELSFAGNIGEHVIQRAKYKEQEATLSGTSIEKSMDSGTGKSMLEEAKNQVRTQRTLLTELIAIKTELINIQGAIDRTHQRLDTQFEAYQRYLSSRILWVPSHPTISLASIGSIKGEFAGFSDNLANIRLAQLTPVASVLLILILILLALGRTLYLHLQTLNAKVGRVREDSTRYTFTALLLTLVRIIPLPLLLLFFGNSLETSGNSAAPYLTASLLHAAENLFLILLLRTACEENGLARLHFGWTQTTCMDIRRLTGALLLWWWPLALVTGFILRVEVDSISAVFGRLMFCLNMSILGVILVKFTWPQSDDKGDYRRWRILGTLLVIAGAVFFVACSILGYIYSVKIIYDALIATLIIAIGLIFLYNLMQRWLLVVRRRLRFRELLAARQALDDDQEREAEPEDIDLPALSAAVSKLLTFGTLALGALGFAYVWAPLFRALDAMQRITLWTVSGTADGEAIVASITLASLALAMLIGLITFVAARNLPQLLALLLMGIEGSTPGSRYAIRKLLGYSIVGVGVIAVLSTLGLQWNRLQWLVAALGVGIGFGLQEIIANFISGLIILFERPIRVGDLITVGDSSGQVIRIHIRATTIRDFDGKELLVPNKEFVTGRLLNWTLSNTDIRMTLEVGIAYGSDVHKAVAILEELLRSHDMILDDPAPDVIFREFGNSSLKLIARYFFNDVDRRAFLLHDLHMKINDAFKENGIVIAFPQIDVHMDPNVSDLPGGERLLPGSAQE